MVTTSSFPNRVTSSPDIERNSLTKEDLEGTVKANVYTTSDINGGNCQTINI